MFRDSEGGKRQTSNIKITMRKTFNLLQPSFLILSMIVLGMMSSCNKEPIYNPTSFKSEFIYEFWLERSHANSNLNRPYQGMIVGDTAIKLLVDYGTDITALEPTIIADADSILPKGKQNFSGPVQYTIWTKGKKRNYIVRITRSDVQFPVFTKIVAGYTHLLALRNDGTVWACGSNSSGQLGLGDYSSRNRLTQLPVYDATEIHTGDAASIIKLKDGTAWGSGNQYGQLGLGNKNPISWFVRVPFLDDATQIAITFDEVFGLKPDGSVWGAGRNRGKILVQGDNELRASFVKVPINNVKQLSGIGSHLLVQKENGEVWGWGQNVSGELGSGDKLDRYTPVLITTPSIGVAKIFAGASTSFLIDKNGKVWGTGANTWGHLGLGDQTNRTSFTHIPFF